MAFTENLRYIMAAQQVNQAQLARDSGLSIAALCKALHCKEEDLTGRELPLHIRRWQPHHETCEQQLTQHLQSNIGPQSDMAENMEVIARMQAKEAEAKQPAVLPVTDLQALFDACVDDNEPAAIFAQFGKQVYQLMAEAKKEED